MSARSYTFDTNILFYAVDPRAGERHARARRLIASADPFRARILVQTLGELCFSVGRKKPALLDKAQAITQELTTLFEVLPYESADLLEALATQQQHGLQFWDALLWATARRNGCTLFLTEDMQDGRVLGGVTFRNPFNRPERLLFEDFD